MLVAQKINDFITGHRAPVCDACIVRELELTAHAHSAQITGALGTTSDFNRGPGECSMCKNERIVIHASRS
jgi:hypothetical protein